MRIFLAFVVAPIVPVAILTMPVFGRPNYLQWVLLLGAIASALTLFIAVPMFFLMNRLDWVRWWQISLAGAFVAIVPDALIYTMGMGKLGDTTVARGGATLIEEGRYTASGIIYAARRLGVLAITGALAGAIFWWVGIRVAHDE